MPASRIFIGVYVAYWIFFAVVVIGFEKKVKTLEEENERLRNGGENREGNVVKNTAKIEAQNDLKNSPGIGPKIGLKNDRRKPNKSGAGRG